MKVLRVICPVCKAERQVTSDDDNMHEYLTEDVFEYCDTKECQEAYNTPEQRLLRAIFGEKVNSG